jgi:hypothetical protein
MFITTQFIVMPDFNTNNSQFYLKWALGEYKKPINVESELKFGRKNIEKS